jgi:Protein of unknown function (DUF3179)
MGRIAIAFVGLALALAGCGEESSPDDSSPADSSADGTQTGDVQFETEDWQTDFSMHSVPLGEFVGGGPPRDGIPSIDDPKFVSVGEADGFLEPREPVATLELDGMARAYPLQILIWHEIVNDELAGRQVAVTYCPLCNSTVAFRRRVEGRVLEFGTTGLLRSSDLVMYDRRTESWWQQITAEAVVGKLTGTELDVLPSQILSWEEFRRLHPDGDVLSRDTGFARDYGRNPYTSYDSNPRSAPFLFDGDPDRSLPPKERVAAIETGDGSAVVYPFSRLEREAPLNDELDGTPMAAFFDPEVGSALDSSVLSKGRNVGAAVVFERSAGGRVLTFERGPRSGAFRDRETGSVWDMTGEAESGPLEGAELEQVPHDDQFWFALAAFYSDAEIRE